MNPDIAKVLNGESEGCIVHGDSLEAIADIPDGCVDAMVTDPPYGISLGDHACAKETRANLLIKAGGYDDSPERFESVIVPIIKRGLSISTRGAVFCIPPSMWKLPAPDAIGGIFHLAAIGRNKWGWSNLIHCLFYGTAPDLYLGAQQTAITDATVAEKTGHPTTKPLAWMLWCVQLAARTGEIILDPFAGSGTTCVAAKKLGRRYIGIEIDEGYCDITKDRLLQLDGKRLGKLHKHSGFFDE